MPPIYELLWYIRASQWAQQAYIWISMMVSICLNPVWLILDVLYPCRPPKGVRIFYKILLDFGQNLDILQTFHHIYLAANGAIKHCWEGCTGIGKFRNRSKCIKTTQNNQSNPPWYPSNPYRVRAGFVTCPVQGVHLDPAYGQELGGGGLISNAPSQNLDFFIETLPGELWPPSLGVL